MAVKDTHLKLQQNIIRVILSLCCFRRTLVFDFTLDPWANQPQFLHHLSSVGYGLHFRKWNLNQSDIGWFFYHKLCASIIPDYLEGWTPEKIKGFASLLIFIFLLWQHAECLPLSKMLAHNSKGSMQAPAGLRPVQMSCVCFTFSNEELPCPLWRASYSHRAP